MNFREIKEKYSVYEVATKILGLTLEQRGNGEYRGVSVAPGPHNTPDALSISGDTWYDFSAGIGGSVLDLVAFAKFGYIDKHSIVEAAKFLAGDEYDGQYWSKYAEERECFIKNVELAHEKLLTDQRALDYLHDRRIRSETIERFKLGLAYESLSINNAYTQEWRLVCPYFDKSGNPIYAATRRLEWAAHEDSPKYHKLKQNDFLKNAPFGLNTLPRKNNECDTLIIGEGMFDALNAAQENFSILFSIGGNFGKNNEEQVISIARNFRRIVTVFDIDNNKAGQGFTCRIGRLLLNNGLNFYCVASYGEGNKDLSDYYTTGGDIQKLVSNAINGYVFMAGFTFWDKVNPTRLEDDYPFHQLSANEKSKRLYEIKQFVYNLRNILDKNELQEVLDKLATYYPSDKIKKFSEGPNAQEILCMLRDKFLEGRNLFYYGSIKHGEYWQYDKNNGYWYRMSDADLQSELSAFFNHEKSTKDIAQLLNMIRMKVTCQIMPEFNHKALLAFTNGTLELDTGILREHRAEDYITWQHKFAYDPQATCKTYDKFLPEVADNEQSRIDFLDDIAAYCLCDNCKQEKMFILIGAGENGKGVYLKVLEALFESANTRSNSESVTHIQPCGLKEATNRILLECSVVNIAHDIDPKLNECASYLKSLATGEAISGNLKFCNTRSFCTRAKLLCSCNEMPIINDTSYGMRRRLMFCNFVKSFTGRADVNLLDKLKTELPGIFNRVYKAYKALIEREKTQGNQAIRPSIDQNALLEEFTLTINPIAAFWNATSEKFLRSEKVAKADIYDEYKQYCERNSLHADTENYFHRQLKKIFFECGVNFREFRTREAGIQLRYYELTKTQEQEEEPKIDYTRYNQLHVEYLLQTPESELTENQRKPYYFYKTAIQLYMQKHLGSLYCEALPAVVRLYGDKCEYDGLNWPNSETIPEPETLTY